MDGNYMEGSANTTKNTDNYLGLDASAYTALGVSATALKSETSFPIAYPVTTETAQEAYSSVLAGAGAFPRDTVDRRIVNEVRTGTATGSGTAGTNKGIIDSPDAVGGYPDYETYNTVIDSDHDGMPDDWESAHGLDPNNPDDRNLKMESGYTALEVYLNELAGETIEFKLATSIPKIQTPNWSVFLTDNELHVTPEVNINNIRIYNLLGQTLMNNKNVNSPKIDISNLLKGVYIAEITTQSGENKTLKFSK